MKYFFTGILLALTITSSAQLQSGIYARQHLASASKQGYNQGGCYSWELGFASNLFPYVTGMDLYLKIDSIPAPPNTVQIWCMPNYNMVYVNTGDSLIIPAGTNDIYFYYNATTTVYLSLEAVGTPLISGESYFCYHSVEVAVFADGCSSIYNAFAGGGGPLDNNKGCTVDGPLSIHQNSAPDVHAVYPNPNNGIFYLDGSGQITIYDLQGKAIISFAKNDDCEIDLSSLSSGIYCLRFINEKEMMNTILEIHH
ncbi:MAG: T9SS type A sorting domain-containing protein [Bacteroidetes bacterium]|nr:T9SS type A sorting domain-containing protein [Bacteroidota bacterium]